MNSRKLNLALCLTSVLLFLLYFFRFALQAQGKPFWADEVDGVYGALLYDWGRLLHTGAPQMSRSPFAYLVDRAMLSLWGDHPQLDWDLRVYLRLAPAFFWSLASAAIFPFAWAFLRKQFQVHSLPLIYLIALGASVFFYENSFMNIYAIETRAYSLWVGLSTLQFCFWWNSIDRKATHSDRAPILLISALMTFTTYAALGQVGILLAVDFWIRMRDTKLRNGKIDFYWWAAISLVCLFITLWYMRYAGNYTYPPSPFSLYFESVLEVILKCFHHHGVQPAYITFPIFLLMIPILRWKETRVQAGVLFTWLSLALSLALFIASMLKGGIYASRYAIFLIPSLTWIYFLGMSTLLSFLFKGLARIPKLASLRAHIEKGLIPALALIALIEVSGGFKKFIGEINQGLRLAESRNAYGKAKDLELCKQPLVYLEEYSRYETPERLVKEFEELNSKCRGL